MLERAQRVARRRGFTWTLGCALFLMTIVVVGFISSLLRAERRMVVAACPIAYVGVDGRIHLTNVEGTIDIELDGPSADGRIWFIGSPPAWSPDGEMIAYTHEWRSDARRIAVVEPATGAHWQLGGERENAHLGGWVGDGVLHEVHRGFRHARSGLLLRLLLPPGLDFHTLHVAPAPRSSGGASISVGPSGVDLRDGQFGVVRRITGGRDPTTRPWVPRLDGTGTWLGWTMPAFREPRYARLIGIAGAAEGSRDGMRFLGLNFADCVFCDWTDAGDILVNVKEQKSGRWLLAILNKEGKLLRRIPTDVPPAPESGASWRRTEPTGR